MSKLTIRAKKDGWMNRLELLKSFLNRFQIKNEKEAWRSVEGRFEEYPSKILDFTLKSKML